MAARLTRRRFLAASGAAGLAAAGSAAGVLATRGNERGPDLPAVSARPASATSTATTVTATPPAAPTGTARLVADRSFQFDTLDALRTGELSTLEILGRTHSRLLQWRFAPEPSLEADLASSWEQPDEQTLILNLDPAARWPLSPPLDGRPVSGDDVRIHFERALALAATPDLAGVQRDSGVQALSSVSIPEDRRVRLTLGRPEAAFVSGLAQRFALVQAPELVETLEARGHELRPEDILGSGPFRFDSLADDGSLRFVAQAGGHRTSRLASIAVYQPPGSVDAFLAGKLDEVIARDRRDTARILSAEPSAQPAPRHEPEPVVSTFFAGAPPWDNADLVRAISAALNRTWLIEALWGGRASPAGPVAPVHGAAALGESALAGFPGYATDPAADARDARARWEAAGGPALGAVRVDFPNIFEPLFAASGVVIPRLREVLGNEFVPRIATYPLISQAVTERRYGNGEAAFWFGWGPGFIDPDPGRDLAAAYGDGGPGVTASASVQAALAALGQDFDASSRVGRARELAKGLLAEGGAGVITWALPYADYFVRGPSGGAATAWWNQHEDAYLSRAG